MKKTERKKLIGGGLYIVLAACVLSAMTINVVNSIRKSNVGSEIDTSPVDVTAKGITDEVPEKNLVNVELEAIMKNTEKEALTLMPSEDDTEVESIEDTPTNDVGNQIYDTFVMPANGKLGKYGGSDVVYSKTFCDYRVHDGIDIAAELGSDVVAFGSGKILKIYDDAMMGKTIEIDHGNGVVSVYENLDEVIAEGIAVGAEVKPGDVIGKVGATAIAECADEPHLHFEVFENEKKVDPTGFFENDK